MSALAVPCSPFKKQWGQTIITMAVAIFLMVLMLLATSRMGEHARRQWYLQTVADNTAHSGAVLMAREMNLTAVLNRALIGNQVAMAQWLGLASWLSMMIEVVEKIAYVAMLIPGLQAAAVNLMRFLNKTEEFSDYGVRAILLVHTGIVSAISAAQQALKTAMVAEIPLTLIPLVNEHDETLDVELHQGGAVFRFGWSWLSYSQPTTTMNRKDGEVLKELTLESRDPFTKGRTYRWFDSWLVRIVKSGGSELETPSNGRWNWNALDALGVYALSVSWTGLKWKHALTLGKGAKAQSGVYRQSSRIPNSYGRSFKVNKKPAQQAMRSMDVLNAYQLPFAFGKLGDTAKIGANALVVTITDRANKQQSFARAEVNFSRPLAIFPRNDKYLEADNLFNALWQAELTPLSATDIASIGIKEWLDED